MESVTGLDIILKNTEFENLQQLKAIENEKEKIQAYQGRIEECEAHIHKMEDDITNYEQQAVKLNRQYVNNKDNIDNLRQTSVMLGEHEDALKKKLRQSLESVEHEKLEQTNTVAKYQGVWMDYEATYNSIEETRGTKQKRQELNLMNENNGTLEMQLKELEVELESMHMKQESKNLLIPWVLEIATLRVETAENLASIQDHELTASGLRAKIKNLSEERAEKLQAAQQRFFKAPPLMQETTRLIMEPQSYETNLPIQPLYQRQEDTSQQQSITVTAAPRTTTSVSFKSAPLPKFRLELPQLTISRKSPKVPRKKVVEKIAPLQPPSTSQPLVQARSTDGSGEMQQQLQLPASSVSVHKPSPLRLAYTQPSTTSQSNFSSASITQSIPTVTVSTNNLFKVPTEPIRQKKSMPSLVSRSLNQAGRAEKGLDCGHQEVQPLASSPAERMEWKDSAQEQHESVNSLSNLVPEPSASVNPPPADSGPELNSAGGECVSKIPISEIRVEMFEDGESQQHEEQSAHQPEVETQGAQYSQQPETQGAQYSQQPETQGAQYSQQPETQGVQYIQQDIQGVQTIQYAQQPDSQENQYSHQPYNPGVQGQGGEYTHQQDIPQPTSQAQYPQQDFQPNQQSMFGGDKDFGFSNFQQGGAGFGGGNAGGFGDNSANTSTGFGGSGFGSGFFGGQQDSGFGTGFSFGDNSSQNSTGFNLNFGSGAGQSSGFSMF